MIESFIEHVVAGGGLLQSLDAHRPGDLEEAEQGVAHALRSVYRREGHVLVDTIIGDIAQ